MFCRMASYFPVGVDDRREIAVLLEILLVDFLIPDHSGRASSFSISLNRSSISFTLETCCLYPSLRIAGFEIPSVKQEEVDTVLKCNPNRRISNTE